MRSPRNGFPALVLSLVLAASPAAAQILNESFEEGVDPLGSTLLLGGSQAIAHWTVAGDALYYASTDWTAGEGTRSVGLYTNAPNSHSAIHQRFATQPGQVYILVFMLAPAPLDGPCLHRELTVRAAGQSHVFATDGVGSAASPLWRYADWNFTAAEDSTTLEFANEYDSRSCGMLVDRAFVTTPDPVRRPSWGEIHRRFQR